MQIVCKCDSFITFALATYYIHFIHTHTHTQNRPANWLRVVVGRCTMHILQLQAATPPTPSRPPPQSPCVCVRVDRPTVARCVCVLYAYNAFKMSEILTCAVHRDRAHTAPALQCSPHARHVRINHILSTHTRVQRTASHAYP